MNEGIWHTQRRQSQIAHPQAPSKMSIIPSPKVIYLIQRHTLVIDEAFDITDD